MVAEQEEKLFDSAEPAPEPSPRPGIDWQSPAAHMRARIALCGDECLSDINRVVRAVNRDYQLSRMDWSELLSELHGQVAQLTGLVADFVTEGNEDGEA